MAQTTPNAFHDFARACDFPLVKLRAKLVAVHTLLEPAEEPTAEVLDAVCHLVSDALEDVRGIIQAHEAAYVEARAPSSQTGGVS